MATIKDFTKIIKIKGVKKYILVKNNGKVAAHDIEDPKTIAMVVLRCGRNSDSFCLPRFKFLLFKRDNNENFFIFPVGNYYLGVIQENDISNLILVGRVLQFIKDLSEKNISLKPKKTNHKILK